jgi:hypothetical protein
MNMERYMDTDTDMNMDIVMDKDADVDMDGYGKYVLGHGKGQR